MLPRLHLVTEAGILEAPRFVERACAVLERLGPTAALHLRGHGVAGGRLYAIATRLVDAAERNGVPVLVNDRVDVALAAGTAGVQLGSRSIPVETARRLLGSAARIGFSAHGADEAARAVGDGADFVLFGTVYPSATHPGEAPAGLPVLASVVEKVTAPVVAIGGVTPERVAAVRGAGAFGVAVLGGVWRAERPEDAAVRYRIAIEEAWR